MGLLDWLTSDIGSGATGVGGNPMVMGGGPSGGDPSSPPPMPPPTPMMPQMPQMPGQGSSPGAGLNISPTILQRGLAGFAGGLKTIKSGTSPMEAFAQGLGGSISGEGSYDKDQQEKMLKIRALENSERSTDGTLDYHNRTLDLQERKDQREIDALAAQSKASADFSARLGASLGLGGAPAAAAPPTPTPAPAPPPAAVAPGMAPSTAPPASIPMSAAPTPTPVAAARPPLPPTAKTWGDDEGVQAGIYDKPAVAGATPPLQANPEVATPKIGAAQVPVLIAGLSNPSLPAGQKEVAKTLLTEAFKNMREPEKVETLRALAANPALLDVEKQLRAAGKTEVSIDQKGESEFAKQAGGTVAKRFEKLSEEGQGATQDLALLGQLRDLGGVIKTGAPAAIQSWLADRGIKVGDNVGAVEAYSAIVDKLTPAQRIPGSGSTSDYDAKMFKNSLPRLINTPQGNGVIGDTLAAVSQYKIDRAAIAEKALTREITPQEALKQIREMPNPYANFSKFAKDGFKADPNDPNSAVPPPGAPGAPGAPAAAPKVVPSTRADIDQSLTNARTAIAANPAARAGVVRKLQDAGIDPSGL